MVKTLQLKLVLLLCMIMGAGTAWADTYTIGWGTASGNNSKNFDGTYGTVSGILSFDCDKNNSTAPAYNSNSSELRLYYDTSGNGNGGSITLTPATGITITGVVMNTSTSPSVEYTVDGGTATSVSASSNTYTISNISASSSLKIQNVQTGTNTQLRIKTIEVTYTSSGTPPTPTTYTVTFNAGTGTFVGNTDFPNTSNEKEAGTYELPSATPATGYTFEGWLATGNATPITGNYTISGDVDFTASYSQNSSTTTGQTLTFDLTSNPGGWPTANSTTLTNYTYTLNSVDYTFALKNVKCNSGYLFLTQPAVLGLPAIEGKKLTKVIAHNSSGCSTSTKVGVSSSASSAAYIAGGEIQTWSTQGSTYTYNLTSTEANTVYYLYVTNKNAQVTSLELTYEPAAASTKVATPVIGGTEDFYPSTEVTITCSTDGATIQYSTNNGTSWATYSGTFTLSETTTVQAKATKSGMTDSEVASKTFTKATPMTVAEARAAIDAGTGTQGVYATGIVSAIPTAWSTDYNNITFNIVDNSGDTNFLQAFRCVSTSNADASTVAVGDEVVVYGNLTKYGETYEFAQGCQLISLTHPVITDPYITADNVNITYDATNGSIAYTIENEPTPAGTLTASVPANSWITLGTVGATVPFTCEANATAAARTETVTLTYTYGNNQTATKDVTVTQAGNPNIFNSISDITSVGTAYSVKGTVVAINAKGFVIGDGTGYVYTYLNAAPTVTVGDKVSVSGTTGTYGHIIQFTNTATVAEATTSNYDGTPAVTVVDASAMDAYNTDYQMSDYVQFEGSLAKSGNYYNITVGTATARISYPTTAQGTALDDLLNKTVRVKGYFAGIASSTFSVMLESVEEVVSTTPSITPSTTTINVTAAETEDNITVTYNNINVSTVDVKFFSDAAGTTELALGYSWMDAEITGTNNDLHYMVDENTSTEARTAYLRIHALDANDDDVYSDVITITQAGYAVDYATLPFYYNGGKSNLPNGLTHSGLGTDYNSTSAPNTQLKFDGTGDVLILKMNSNPITLSFNIKGNSFSGGTFTVSTSANGTDYTALGTYTDLGDEETKTYNLNSSVRYIKWTYTEKSSGNVGLGKIRVNCDVVTIKADRQYTGFSCDKPLDFTGSDLTAQIVTSATGKSKVVTKVPASTGLIVGLDDPTTDAQTIIVPVCTDATENVDDNMLVPVLTAATIMQETADYINYVFGKAYDKEQFFKISSGGMEVPANNVYLAVPKQAAKDLDVIGFGGDATSINALETETVNGNIYNLQGQKVNRAQKGVYIVNGRKVVIK